MIRSNGVRLLSSHLIRDACKSIYEGVFHRTLDSGLWTLSRVIGGVGHGVNLNNPNTSIRGSASLSRDNNYEMRAPIDGVTDAEEDEQYHGRKYPTGGFPSVHHKDIIDCIRIYGLHGDPDLTLEFLLERSRNPIYPSRTEYRKDDPVYMAELDEFMKVTQTYGPDYYIDDNLGVPDVEPDSKLLSNNGDSDNKDINDPW